MAIVYTLNVFSYLCNIFVHTFSFFLSLFILREREGTGEGQREREGERENSKQALCCQHRDWHRLDLTNHEIMTWAQIKSQTLNWLSHPGAPPCAHFYIRDWLIGVCLYVCVRVCVCVQPLPSFLIRNILPHKPKFKNFIFFYVL